MPSRKSGNGMLSSSSNSENQRHKFKSLLQRTGKFQNYFGEMWQLISNYTVKTACLRDKNDDIAKCLNNFTKVEEFSTSSKLAMAVAAELLASVGDYEDLEVQRMETLVLPNLSSYGIICDSVKADLLNAMQAIKRQTNKKKTVNNLKRKKTSSNDPKLQQVLEDAIREYERTSAESTRLCQLSQEHVIKFEHKRLIDLKETLGNFVKIQIATRAKSLELLSQTYKHIQSIDEDADLDILKESLKITDKRKKKRQVVNHKTEVKKSLSAKREEVSGGGDRGSTQYDYSNTDDDGSEEVDVTFSDEINRLEVTLRSNEKKTKSHHHHHHSSSHKESDKNRKDDSLEVCKSMNYLSKHKHFETKENENRCQSKGKSKQRGKMKTQDDLITITTGSRDHDVTSSTKVNRPTTAPRPYTVPASRMNEVSSENEGFIFRSKNRTSKNPTPRNAYDANSCRKSYYYSQSEDDDSANLHPKYPNTNYNRAYNRTHDNQDSRRAHTFTEATHHNGRRVSFNHIEEFSENPKPSRINQQPLLPPMMSLLKRSYC